MTWRDLSLPPAIAVMMDLWFEAVFRGVRMAGRMIGDSEIVRTRRIVKRISAILRHCFVLLAVRVEVTVRRPGAAAPSPPAPSQTAHGGGDAAAPRFPLWASVPLSGCHPVAAAGEAQDPGLRGFDHPKSLDPGLGLRPPRDEGRGRARKLAGLRAALLNPMPYVKRLARKLAGDGIFLPTKIPTTMPKTDEREFWEERRAAALEARFALSQYWRARRDSS